MIRFLLTCVAAFALLAVATQAPAQDDAATRPDTRPDTRPGDPATTRPASVAGRITEVVCYEQTALVTREVPVPAGAGRSEIVVGPLPPSLQPGTLYAEANADGQLRVLSTRYRQRIERTATDEEVQRLQAEIEALRLDIKCVQARREALQSNLQLVSRLENFAANSISADAADGDVDAEAFIQFADYLSGRQRELREEAVAIEAELAEIQEAINFTQQKLSEAQAAGDRIVREAVVVVDNAGGEADTVQLAYLVSAAGWRPSYRVRASEAGDAATLEYLAGVFQQTGEDWRNVQLTLSTASPRLNAAPPELEPVAVTLVPGDSPEQAQQRLQEATQSLKAAREELQQAQQGYEQAQGQRGGYGGGGGGFGGGGGGGGFGGAGGEAERARDETAGGAAVLNRAAARVLEAEVLGDTPAERDSTDSLTEGQSVTYKLDGTVTVPWRDEEQLLEIARVEFDPEVYYKAVPVLTPNVYRVASLTNPADRGLVLLPGPAGVYLGGDFVGRTALPLVAAGQQFEVGLGVDPQLTITRELIDRDAEVRGGNQVRRVAYLVRIESFKEEAVPVRLWERLPTPPQDNARSIAIELVEGADRLSEDAEYLRTERPDGLLRWDLTVAPNEPTEVRFAYTLAFDRTLEIGGFETK